MGKEFDGAVTETEDELIERARASISRSNWVVGECATKWTKKYARGRTDADFGRLVGMTGDQVFQRRHVWETFADVVDNYRELKWSHFYVALKWNDAPECLLWAQENHATVAEMRAWRRLQQGEDLTVPAETEGIPDELISFVPDDPTLVRDPDSFAQVDGLSSADRPPGGAEDSQTRLTVAAAGRGVSDSGSDYAPFRQGAGGAAPKDVLEEIPMAVAERPKASAAQTVKRMTTTLERCTKVLTPEFAKEFRTLPEKVRNRFIKSVGELSSKVADLM